MRRRGAGWITHRKEGTAACRWGERARLPPSRQRRKRGSLGARRQECAGGFAEPHQPGTIAGLEQAAEAWGSSDLAHSWMFTG